MKKLFAFVLAMVIVACMFTACSKKDTQPENIEETQPKETPSYVSTDLSKIAGHSELVYDIETRTVYYFLIYAGGRTFMSPYIINGHFCEYVDGEIVEVIPTVRIEDATN